MIALSNSAANTLPSIDHVARPRYAVNIDLLDGSNDIRIKNRHFRTRYYEVGTIAQLNIRFIQILDELRQSMAQEKPEIDLLQENIYQKTLSQLREIGAQAYAILPTDFQEYMAELDARATEDGKGLMLDFTFPRKRSLFWEMIYMGKADGEPVEIDQFWGFRYPIGYLDWESALEDRIRLREGIFASVYEKLDFSQEEVWQIKSILHGFAKNQNIKLVLHSPKDVFAADRFNESQFLNFLHTEPFIYGIVHFACHCFNPDNQGATETYLQISAHDQDILLKLARFLTNRHSGFKFKPFVFLNACESATPKHFLEALNFPSVLLDFGAGGVIATACTVPDNFALTFSTTFYRILFNKLSENIPPLFSETLLETRLEIWEKYRNPLGLAYGLRAETTQWLKFFE